MARVDYDKHQHEVYARARAISPERMAGIMQDLAAHLPAQRPLTVVDVGCGVGRFTPALADTFGGPVYGVEPAATMRRQAEANAKHPAVTYLEGKAEALPLPDGSCDAALLWFVWHHVQDRQAAAHELARVLRPGGTVLLRTTAADRLPGQWWFDHFPRARDIEAEQCNTSEELVGLFAAAGCTLTTIATIELSSTYGRDLEMLRLKAVSTLELLTPEEYERGLAAATTATAGIERDEVISRGDLFVFRS